MARVTDSGFSGMIGSVIFYNMNGKTYARSKPKKRKTKRTTAEKNASSIFGTVSKFGTAMIKSAGESEFFKIPFGRPVYNHLRGWMRNLYAENGKEKKWELSVQQSGMCQMSEGTDLRDCWKCPITVTNSGSSSISIVIPEFNPKKDCRVPNRTMKVNLKFIAVTSTFSGSNKCHLSTTQYNFDFGSSPVPAQTFVLQTAAGTGDIALVMMAMEFETGDQPPFKINTETKWLPAAAIAMGRLT